VNDVGHDPGDGFEIVFILGKPLRTPLGHTIDHLVRRKPAQLEVAVDIGRFVEVVLRPGRAVGHQDSRRVESLRLDNQLHHVFI
jgi:hypothetical protein